MTDELVEIAAKSIGLANHETPESITRLIRDSHGELVETWVTYLPLARAVLAAVTPEIEARVTGEIVAWLRGCAAEALTSREKTVAGIFEIVADAIERGEYHKESQP